MTDATKNSRLFAVSSTTCSALPLFLCVFKLFFPPIDIQHSHRVSVPTRYSREKNSVVTSFETDLYMHIAGTTRYTRYELEQRYTCGVRVVVLEHGGGALGVFKSPVCTHLQSINPSINQPTNQSINQSINQSTNQSINQSVMGTSVRFT